MSARTPSTLSAIRADLDDLKHYMYRDYTAENMGHLSNAPGTLDGTVCAVFAEDATDATALEAVAEFIHTQRDSRPWSRSARFGLMLTHLEGLAEFDADRAAWAEHCPEGLKAWADNYRKAGEMTDVMRANRATEHPAELAAKALEAGGEEISGYDVEAIAAELFEPVSIVPGIYRHKLPINQIWKVAQEHRTN